MNLIAFYLPQFHEFEENNAFWGEGFTEWTHLRKAEPKFNNHRILKPHQDIGYYCLEDRQTRKNQAMFAKKYGIYGFCYYHYWFFDRPVMQKPLELMLNDGEPDLPFCLSWANESWRNSMNGGDSSIILQQNYGKIDEWEKHFQYLLNFFKHKNYIKIDGKPALVIYRVAEVENYVERFTYWKKRAENYGLGGIFFISTLGNFHNDPHHLIKDHVDATVEFFPNFLGNPNLIVEKVGNRMMYDPDKVKEYILLYPQYHRRQIGGVLTGFDNSARNALRCNIILNTDTAWFKNLLIEKMKASSENYIFINAWNEWSEGAVLEPEEVNGYKYLKVVADVQRKLFI